MRYQHRWVQSNVTHLRISAKKCVTKGGGCAMAAPVTSALSLAGRRSLLPPTGEHELTRLGQAEDARSIVLDEYALHPGSAGATFIQRSEGFKISPLIGAALESYAEVARQNALPDAGRTPDTVTGAPALVIQHQQEHEANAAFAPAPQVTFTPQPHAGSPESASRGFAIVDIGASGRILHTRIVANAPVAALSELEAAISHGVQTQFLDARRHDHRVYFAYQIEQQVVRMVGSPVVTLPMCCRPPPCPRPPCGPIP
jgi:hypothetical protein